MAGFLSTCISVVPSLGSPCAEHQPVSANCVVLTVPCFPPNDPGGADPWSRVPPGQSWPCLPDGRRYETNDGTSSSHASSAASTRASLGDAGGGGGRDTNRA